MPRRLYLQDTSISLTDHERRFTLNVPELQIRPGDVVGLTGLSGTGKTLLLELLGLLRRPTRARQFVIDEDTGSIDLTTLWDGGPMSPPDMRAEIYGFVPQSGGLLPFLNVSENITLPQRISNREDAGWVDHLIDDLGLGDVRSLRPGALSIGQRQRVAIARALSHRPAFVVADEPTAALDPDAASGAMQMLIQMAASGGSGVIISSHDLALLAQFPMRRVQLNLISKPGTGDVLSQLSEGEPV